ncbi:MAG: carboxypeptidase-like regulatory domain-containing protein [Gemmatimonadota bacterium]
MRDRSAWILGVVLSGLQVAPAVAGTWAGSVRDIRTEAPLAGARVCAGILGRVDLACTDAGTDGTFQVSYAEGALPGADGLFYLYVDAPAGTPYYNQARARQVPGEATCQLVPTTAYIRGRVVGAADGAPLAGIDVALVQPGRIDQSTTSDGAGEFVFSPVGAYENLRAQYNTYGVPAAELPPASDGDLVSAAWGITAPYGAGSDRFATVAFTPTPDGRLAPELPLLSSATAELFTWVELRLPAAGTAVDDPTPYIRAQIGRPDGTTSVAARSWGWLKAALR